MVKVKVKVGDITKFLDAWDKNAHDLNMELKRIHQKQKKEQAILSRKKGLTFRLHR